MGSVGDPPGDGNAGAGEVWRVETRPPDTAAWSLDVEGSRAACEARFVELRDGGAFFGAIRLLDQGGGVESYQPQRDRVLSELRSRRWQPPRPTAAERGLVGFDEWHPGSAAWHAMGPVELDGVPTGEFQAAIDRWWPQPWVARLRWRDGRVEYLRGEGAGADGHPESAAYRAWERMCRMVEHARGGEEVDRSEQHLASWRRYADALAIAGTLDGGLSERPELRALALAAGLPWHSGTRGIMDASERVALDWIAAVEQRVAMYRSLAAGPWARAVPPLWAEYVPGAPPDAPRALWPVVEYLAKRGRNPRVGRVLLALVVALERGDEGALRKLDKWAGPLAPLRLGLLPLPEDDKKSLGGLLLPGARRVLEALDPSTAPEYPPTDARAAFPDGDEWCGRLVWAHRLAPLLELAADLRPDACRGDWQGQRAALAATIGKLSRRPLKYEPDPADPPEPARCLVRDCLRALGMPRGEVKTVFDAGRQKEGRERKQRRVKKRPAKK